MKNETLSVIIVMTTSSIILFFMGWGFLPYCLDMKDGECQQMEMNRFQTFIQQKINSQR